MTSRFALSRSPLAVMAFSLALGLSACSSDGDSGADGADSSATSAATDAVDVALVGTIELKFAPDTATATAGDITFSLNAEGVPHNLIIEGQNSDEVLIEAATGETNTATASLVAGEYVFYCSIAGHREAGMEGVLTVS
ncbi:MAG: plastocyanin [Glaciecola sp.]|jgi:plastocyanin